MLVLLPAGFSWTNNFNRLHISLRLDDKNFVLERAEAEIFKPGELSNLTGDLSQVDLLLGAFTSKYFSFPTSYINFLSCKLARSTL